MEDISLIPIGMVIATFASLIGIGGGLLWAPYFILVRGFDPHLAVMFSFLIQFVGMGSATLYNIRKKNIFWKMVVQLLPFIVVGVLAGAFLNQRVANPEILKGILGIVSLVVSIFFAFQTEKYDAEMLIDRSTKPPLWLRVQALFFGSISGLLSIGIGDFLIPVMRSKLKIPMRFSIGTNLFLNFSLALTGALFHLSFAEYSIEPGMFRMLGYAWLGVLVGGQLGPKLLNVVDDHRVKEIFVYALLLVGIHLIYSSL